SSRRVSLRWPDRGSFQTDTHPCPERTRLRRRERILVGPVGRRGNEAATGSERIPGEESGGRIFPVEEVDQPREDLGVFPQAKACVQIDHGVTGDPSGSGDVGAAGTGRPGPVDRKSTRLNSSHDQISYAVFCLKKKMERGSVY